ncbi:uncharacterized protein LOC122536181 isoform X1 [Frieseomelitta varia]|uniref:uncharacterized protein LOC122536181 isoform X1 n=1 Tax=Frieseomelitta varia TaxID=561572 RepID=UPI001CB680BA|nr:uncharacterized protein LOC122536181 isoform X1 [Frieseomelitta varia]XP_043524270.1 uncharacterized protein LOC122536181 isoform X1 [Frieseomelitta varia]XP_043524271.1 uncharacterized protein LOC122536181 isoform X1 [Frieseomelitta varia]
MVDDFLMFAFEKLIKETAMTVELFMDLQEWFNNQLAYSNAQQMFKAIVEIRKKFNETAEKSKDIKLTADETANLIGLKFNYVSRSSENERYKEYEEKVDKYYKDQRPRMSPKELKRSIVDALQSANSQTQLVDFLGFDAIGFIEYIIKNQEFIIANFDRLDEEDEVLFEDCLASDWNESECESTRN